MPLNATVFALLVELLLLLQALDAESNDDKDAKTMEIQRAYFSEPTCSFLKVNTVLFKTQKNKQKKKQKKKKTKKSCHKIKVNSNYLRDLM